MKKKSIVKIGTVLLTTMMIAGCGATKEEFHFALEDTVMESKEQKTEKLTGEVKPADSAGKMAEMKETEEIEMTDTIQWFATSFSILTANNEQNYRRFNGLDLTEENIEMRKESLDEWWGVTDRASADDIMEWILTEGHRTYFMDAVKNLEGTGIETVSAEKRSDYLLENYEVTEEEAADYALAYNLYEKYGENAVDAWDYVRAISLTSFYYEAGYYSKEEALDKALEIALVLQSKYDSWDELEESYLHGYSYWTGNDDTERREVYEDLKTRSDNPFTVDYHTELTKTW